MRDYDEDAELTHYVLRAGSHLVTELEFRIRRVILFRAKGHGRLLGPDEEIEEALREGTAAFERRLRDRLLTEHGQEIFINRCPSCRRIVRTPRARLCLWCGQDWHP